MQLPMPYPLSTALIASLVCGIIFVLIEVLWLWRNGAAVPRPTIPRGIQHRGSGPGLRLVIMGDSTSVSQGSSYHEGYAAAAADHLSRTYRVSWLNVGVSGARVADVAASQLAKATAFKPDVALIAVGANDVTHGTPLATARRSISATIAGLQAANPDVRIVLTGSPDMGSPRRLPQPLRWLAGKRTRTFNAMVQSIAKDHDITLAPIAAKTGAAFRADPSLFAPDNFHPNAAGYALWIPVITQALDESLA